MNIGILGTGVVGTTLATALTQNGHNVRLGSRSANNEKALAWVKSANDHATLGDFSDAAAFGDLVFICLNGAYALDAVRSVPADVVENKTVIDVTNPLDFSQGMPPSLVQGLNNTYSLSEAIQAEWPGAHVVKALNTLTVKAMIEPSLINGGDHHLLICSDHEEAKSKVKQLLEDEFGWKTHSLLDLGPLRNARVTEAYVPLWVTLMQTLGTPMFSIKIVK